LGPVVRRFLDHAEEDQALRDYSQGKQLTSHYVLGDAGLEFHMCFEDGRVVAGMGAPDSPAEMRLETQAEVLDGMFTGRTNAMRAAMTGKVAFSGDARAAMGLQQIQGDLSRLYVQARKEVQDAGSG
jgi:putative sterol carrier protein